MKIKLNKACFSLFICGALSAGSAYSASDNTINFQEKYLMKPAPLQLTAMQHRL